LGFQIRGVPTYQYYLDGVRVSPDPHHEGFRDMANIERIDVVKGPASLLYGRTEPGGAINLVTKQPLTDSRLAWEQQAGSFRRKRSELDATSPGRQRVDDLSNWKRPLAALEARRGRGAPR
jgi:iron complex outermembrane recepter protein